MKTLLAMLVAAGVLIAHPVLAAKDAHQEWLTLRAVEVKRAQALEQAKPRQCVEARQGSARSN